MSNSQKTPPGASLRDAVAVGASPARQQRSQQKRDRLINALDKLLKKKPFDQITISEIAKTAKVSPATIYQRFNRKDAAISILIELYLLRTSQWATHNPAISSVKDSRDLYTALVSIGHSAWLQVESLGHIMRPAYLYSRLRPDLLGPAWTQMQASAFSGFKSFLSHFESDIKTDDLDNASATIANFFNLMLLGPLLHPEIDRQGAQNADAFSRELADFAFLYLTHSKHREHS